MHSLKQKAEIVAKQLTSKNRSNGDLFITLKSDAPEYIRTFVRSIHQGYMPDDFKYSFLAESLRALREHDSLDDAKDSLESDIYNHELIRWLASHSGRVEYVNEAVIDGIASVVNFNLIQIIGVGQLEEKKEVFDLVVQNLKNLSPEIEITV